MFSKGVTKFVISLYTCSGVSGVNTSTLAWYSYDAISGAFAIANNDGNRCSLAMCDAILLIFLEVPHEYRCRKS